MLYDALNDLTDRKQQQFQMFLQSHTSILYVLTLVHKRQGELYSISLVSLAMSV